MTGAWILLGALVVTAGVAAWHARSRGRFRGRGGGREPVRQPVLAAPGWRALGAEPGERATLLQFSSAFCAPCRTTRVVLADVASLVPGVAHVEVDAEQHLDLVRRVGVLRTPTTLVLDAGGREVTRASGTPRTEQVLAALATLERPHDGHASHESDDARE